MPLNDVVVTGALLQAQASPSRAMDRIFFMSVSG